MLGYYHSRLSFGTVDGPGIRYVLFVTKCQLGCRFCHNPDTWEQGSQQIDSAEIVREVLDYRGFYEPSGGGITVSGGEPLLQPDFVADVLARCQVEGIDTALDTCGFAPKENILRVLPHVDRVLFSLKGASDASYSTLTRARSMQPVLSNLRLIAARKLVTLRYVLIPGYTDDAANLAGVIKLARELPEADIEVLPYHTMGISKWEKLGWEYELTDTREPTKAEVQAFRERLIKAGCRLAVTEE